MTARKHRLAIILILLLGFALRIYQLDGHAFNGDEAFSIVNWTHASLDYLFNHIALIDPQPPIALLSLYGWVRLVGDTEFASRMLSVLASTITIAAAYGISRRVADKKAAVIAALLCAVNPFQLWHAQDVRNYALWMSGSAVASWLVLVITDKAQKWTLWLLYVLTAAISIYTFYLEGFVLLAHNLYVLFKNKGKLRSMIPWLGSQLAIGLLLAAWFLRPALRNSGYQPTAGLPDIPAAIHELILGIALPQWLQYTLVQPFHQSISPASIISILLVITGSIIAWRRLPRHRTLFLLLLAFIPMTCLAILSLATGNGYFRPRYVGASSVPLIILIAVIIAEQITTKLKYLGSFIVSGFFVLSLIGVWNYRFQYAKSPDWHTIVETLYAQTGPDDLIIRNFPDPAFDYYYQGETEHTILPDRENASQVAVGEQLSQLSSQYNYLWFFPVPSAAWDGQQIVATWLNHETQHITDQWIGSTHLIQYSSWEVKEGQITNPASISFDNLTELKGYRLTNPIWQPGATATIELFWEPVNQIDRDLTVFVHLLGPLNADGSPLWAQADQPPQNGRISTQTWEKGRLFRDIYTLDIPLHAPPGDYTITVGFYDPVTNERFPIKDIIPQGEPDGAILLTVTIPEVSNQ